MSIDIRTFVDVNIIHNKTSSANSVRDTIVLFTEEGVANQDNTYRSYTDFHAAKSTLVESDKYAKVFFENGGNKLRLIEGITNAQTDLADAITALDDKYIVIATTMSAAFMKAIAITRDASVEGIHKKILLCRLNADDADATPGLAVKYSAVDGAEMTIAAYLSNIEVYGQNTVHDYDFTKEVISEVGTDDQTLLDTCMEHNFNIDIYLAGANRNIGGNLKDGEDLVNSFMLIVCQQTLTEVLLYALTTKLKGEIGLSSIRTVMSQELNNYVSNGYLTTDKVWGDTALTETYNGQTWTIIDANTPLQLGYYITILPITSLTTADKTARKTPPIYVILADEYGIRKIVVQGEVK